ncbi:MAG: toxin-antitoxin system YwqK family antitoxin [Fibrobacterota bacterium]|nr:toxin-antitoxin system YwqK family antitoxin [Fibrobacterota bacterium]
MLYDKSGKISANRRFTIKTVRVKALGSAGDSIMAEESCAWLSKPGLAPLKHGLCTMKYGDGKVMASRFYRDGRLHGSVKALYADGLPWLEGSYLDDIPTGRWRTWSRSGNLQWSTAYRKGEKEGTWEEWFPDGQRKSISKYRKGKADGGYHEWYPTGKTRLKGDFRGGHREGVETAWYPDGARLYSARYVTGQLDGEFFQWHPGGKLRLHCRFVKGRKDGASRVWYRKGGLQELAYYKNGSLNGSYRTWDADGAPMAMKEYRNGAVTFDSKAEELLDLLGADQLRVPVGMMGFYWGMGSKECRANLGLYQASNVRADELEITAQVIAFPDRRATQAQIRLSFNGQGELWGIKLDLLQKTSADVFPICESLEIEIGAELGTAGLRKAEGRSEYTMTRKREWGRFTVATGTDGSIR